MATKRVVDDWDYPFSAQLRELRLEQHMSVQELGELTGYAPSHIRNVEAGKRNGGPQFLAITCAVFPERAEQLRINHAKQLESHRQTGLNQKLKSRAPRPFLKPLEGTWVLVWQGTSPGQLYAAEEAILEGISGGRFSLTKKRPDGGPPLGEPMHPEPWQASCEIDETHRIRGHYECHDRAQPRVDGQLYLDVLRGGELIVGTWTGITAEHPHAMGLVVLAREHDRAQEEIERLAEDHDFFPLIFKSRR